ncbi:MAG: FadD3 family acyl-CoA ligase [Candidatus Binatia bacterium]|nr:FadD3 family acyl-CoA ligase [Candidatus Binatia bacterium]
MQRTIPGAVQEAAEQFGSAIAIEEGDTRLSFSELADAGVRVARAFIAAGIGPGDRVAIWAPNIHEWILAAIGLHSAGATLVPLNTRLKKAEAAYILQSSGAKLLCTVTDFLGVDYVAEIQQEDIPSLEGIVALRGSTAGATGWDEFLARGESVPEEKARERAAAVSPDDLSDIMFTSGTTGKPKGVMTTHGQNTKVFLAWSGIVGLTAGDRYLIVNPFFHAFGYKAGWLSCILRGATALPHLVFDVPQVLARIGEDKISMLPGPPTLYQSILAHPDLAKHDISNLRLAVTGAAAIPVELIHRMKTELGFDTVITGYGLTESCGTVSMCREDDDAETIATTSGRAIDDVEVRCVNEAGEEVARGEPGEVVVRGYNVMKGYLDDPAETAKAVDADNWLHTGDIAIMDDRGYLRITDRIKDMFIMGGFNCYPAEIENLMFSSGDFAQVAVIGVPDARMGEVGMAFVVPGPGKALEPDGVITWCRANMANYKVPRFVEVVSELPVNASGKVTKFVLRERAKEVLGG